MRSATVRRGATALGALLLLAITAVLAPVRPGAASATGASAGDGTTSATAGASCYGIKQAYPASGNGIYWVLTPALDRPLQVYCDQTTAGGGWVLIGRGRQGWSFSNFGQGTPETVRTTVSGSGAYTPASLSTDLVKGLINGAGPNQLSDGIRVQRATNAAGTTTQDYRLYPKYSQWTWSIQPGQRLNKIVVDGISYANGNTRDTIGPLYDYPSGGLEGAQGVKRLMTFAWINNGYTSGWGFGSGITGSTSSTTALYQPAGGYVLPFTRVWLRPRILNSAVTFTPVPAGGLAADPNAPSLRNRTEKAPWGVVGMDHTGEDPTTPWYTGANVIKAYGSRVYVGGRFTGVQQGPSGTPITQRSLAAFDLDGNWISTFRPTFVGRVWDMTMTADGKLIVGGDFSSVNGLAHTSGLVALNPTTGAVITTWRANVTRTTGPMIVRALDIHGDTIYAAGRFNTVQGATANPTIVSSAVSLRASDGGVGGWRPQLTGTAVKIRAAAAGDRVYLAGYFNAVNGDTNQGYFGITDAATGAVSAGIGPWIPSISSNKKYQQAVAEYGNQVIVGGSEHDLQFYDRNRTTLLDADITKQGGDTQAIEVYGNNVYFGCHCDQTIFQGTNNWGFPSGFRSIDRIMLVGRINATTHEYDTSWYPSALKGTVTDGVWSISQDSRGCLWVAGDLIRGAATGVAANDWLGGFGRFCPTDSTAPTKPGGLAAVRSTGKVHVSWTASSDAGGGITYDIIRNDRVIANVAGSARSFDDLGGTATSRYTVRAADAAGNRSATLPTVVSG